MYMNDRIMFAVSISGNIFFWAGFVAGVPEGVAQGRHFEKEDIEESKKSRH